MKLKPLIRIIKSEQRKDADRDAESAARNKAATEDSDRRITTTVSAWVYEFQQ